MSTALDIIDTISFNNADFLDFEYRGQRCCIAMQFGKVLGYKQTNSLRKRMRGQGKWAPEFIEGEHYFVLKGEDLKALFAASSFAGPNMGVAKIRTLLILTAAGMELACLRTSLPIGIELRSYLVKRGIVSAVLTGQDVTVQPRKQVETPDQREARLMKKEERLNREHVLKMLKDVEGHVDPTALAAYRLQLAQQASGISALPLLPPAEEWATATDIAKRLGVSKSKVGRTRKALGFTDTIPGLCKTVLNTTPQGRSVTMTLYSPEAVERITERLR